MAQMETWRRHPREYLRWDISTFKQSKHKNNKLQTNEPRTESPGGAETALSLWGLPGSVESKSVSSEPETLRSTEKGLSGPQGIQSG